MIDETIEEIRRMQTHSSSVVAVKATTALEELLDRDYRNVEGYERDLERNAGALRRANPSHASLHKAMREVVGNVLGETDSVEAAKSRTSEEIDRIVEGIETGKHEAAARAATTFEDGETVLTHDFSRVVVGMTCIVGDTLYNRIGTFPLVAAASVANVPVTVVGSESKVIESDFVFENEEREPAEVIREPVAGVRIENPAYDATPMALIDEVVTDRDRSTL